MKKWGGSSYFLLLFTFLRASPHLLDDTSYLLDGPSVRHDGSAVFLMAHQTSRIFRKYSVTVSEGPSKIIEKEPDKQIRLLFLDLYEFKGAVSHRAHESLVEEYTTRNIKLN